MDVADVDGCSVGLSFKSNSSDRIRILKSTFWISCFARRRCFWFKVFNAVAISSPKISHSPLLLSVDANLLITWSALNSSSSISDLSRFLTFNFVFSIFPPNFRFRNGVSRFYAISSALFFREFSYLFASYWSSSLYPLLLSPSLFSSSLFCSPSYWSSSTFHVQLVTTFALLWQNHSNYIFYKLQSSLSKQVKVYIPTATQ